MSENIEKFERRLLARWNWILFAAAFAVIGWLSSQVWAYKVSTEPHGPTIAAAKLYTDEQMKEVAKMNETINWMSTVMELKWGVRRPSSIRD